MPNRQISCSVCTLPISHNHRYYYSHVSNHIICQECEPTHSTGLELVMYICGVSDYWDTEASYYGDGYDEFGSYADAVIALKQGKGGEVSREAQEKLPAGIAVCKGSPKMIMRDVEVLFPQETYNQMFAYVDATDVEISGVGRVSRQIEDNRICFVVHELFLLKQRNTGTSTHLDPAELSNFVIDRVQKNLPVDDVKIWWHSHVNMQAFWSGTDEACCAGFENDGVDKENWYLSIVVNKRREMRCRLDIFKPYRVVIDELPVKVIMNFSAPDKKKFEDEVKEKCIESWRGHTTYPGYGGFTESSYWNREEPQNLKQIEFKFGQNKQEDLAYYKDMTHHGKQIETLHYLKGAELYKLFTENQEVPTHRVPNLKNMEKERGWYLDNIGNMCQKTKSTKITKAKSMVTDEEQILFYKLLPACSCAWCLKQKELIEKCAGLDNKEAK